MSDIQFDEFRSRVDRIERNMGKSRRYLRRDRFGVLLQRKETKPKSALVPFAKTVFKFYILFAITKAVLIYNADQEAYAQKIVQWSNGAGFAPIMSVIMAPDFLTPTIHTGIDNLAAFINNDLKK